MREKIRRKLVWMRRNFSRVVCCFVLFFSPLSSPRVTQPFLVGQLTNASCLRGCRLNKKKKKYANRQHLTRPEKEEQSGTEMIMLLLQQRFVVQQGRGCPCRRGSNAVKVWFGRHSGDAPVPAPGHTVRSASLVGSRTSLRVNTWAELA